MSKIDKVKIIGIDPGTNVMGYAIIDYFFGNFNILALGEFKLKRFETHQEKLREIFLFTQELIETYMPTELAIESPFYGKNVQSMLKLGRAQGVTIAAGITMGLNITEYAPKKIKQSITGNGNSSKEQVAAMLGHMLKIKIEEGNLDATDALGVAMCHYNHISRGSVSGKKYSSWKKFISENPDKISR